MFFLLVIVVTLHQLYSTLIFKNENWPLRGVFLRLIECVGRVLLFPLILLYYMLQINTFSYSILFTMVIGVTAIGLREAFGLSKAIRVSTKKLVEKANNTELKIVDFSKLEIVILNLLLFGKFSFSFRLIANNLLKQGELVLKTKRDSAPTFLDAEDISNLERKSSLHSPSGIGIQLVSTSKSDIRRKYGADSDDDDDEEDGNNNNNNNQEENGNGVVLNFRGRTRSNTGANQQSNKPKSPKSNNGNGAESRGSKGSVHWDDTTTTNSDVIVNPVYNL